MSSGGWGVEVDEEIREDGFESKEEAGEWAEANVEGEYEVVSLADVADWPPSRGWRGPSRSFSW